MESSGTKRPNFLLIVADDLGFSDPGCYGSEIKTPNIDELSKHGVRFTDFHTTALCSPTRAMLMSGSDHHLVGLGQMYESRSFRPEEVPKPGYEGYLTSNVATLPEVLRDDGYHTMMAGKWHLGLRPEQAPISRGFERSFALLPGMANHYAYEPQLEDRTKSPGFLDTHGIHGALHIEGQDYVDNSKFPESFYSSDYYVDKLLQYTEERPKDKPFFAYLPFSAPHWPLQCPEENQRRYKGVYDEGPDKLRLQRLAGLKKHGLVPDNVKPHPVIALESEKEWSDMDAATRAKTVRAMEAYAGMVDRIDYNIGRYLDYLKQNGLFENTCCFFMSDNGPEGLSIEASPMMGPDLMPFLAKYYNNSIDNIGRKDSYVWYGTRWAQAATAPARLYKGYSTEGGVRVPLVMKPADDRNPSICHQFCTAMDIMPTILDMAGVAKPGKEYNGRSVVPIRGQSWVPYFRKETQDLHEPTYVTGWEIHGQKALRRGDWKITFARAPKGPNLWQLYNLSTDPGETNDLAAENKDIFAELLELYETYAKEMGIDAKVDAAVLPPDQMEDPHGWMKFESSGAIFRGLRHPRRGE